MQTTCSIDRLFSLLLFSGNLFHIDFGYILGRDPKPLPPPMKLSKEMVKKSSVHPLCDCCYCYNFSFAIIHLKKVAHLQASNYNYHNVVYLYKHLKSGITFFHLTLG